MYLYGSLYRRPKVFKVICLKTLRLQSQSCNTKGVKEFFQFYSPKEINFSDKYKPLNDKDYERFISKRSATRDGSMIREITSLAHKISGNMVSLAEGIPSKEIFPFCALHLQSKRGQDIVIKDHELSTALQYGPSQGLPSFVRSINDFQTLAHRPPRPYEVIVTNGAQHGIYQCCDLLLDKGDPILVTEYCYSGAYAAMRPYDPEILSIKEDQDGICLEAIEDVLSNRLTQGKKMPKFLYIVPTGNNPTGTLLTNERRKVIYELACKYDFLIIEDDPYMFLNYTDKPISSFLSMDSCGRVIRLDSLSKVVTAGLRAGWVTAPPVLARRLELHSQAELLHSCSLGQTIIGHLLRDHETLASQLSWSREVYRSRRDLFHAALCRAGVGELARWSLPAAGLFMWVNVRDVKDVYNMAFKTAFNRGLMIIPGHPFLYNYKRPCTYLRLAFSSINREHMDPAAETLADIIKNEQDTSTSKGQISFATTRQIQKGLVTAQFVRRRYIMPRKRQLDKGDGDVIGAGVA